MERGKEVEIDLNDEQLEMVERRAQGIAYEVALMNQRWSDVRF